jgi:hypothetical protein
MIGRQAAQATGGFTPRQRQEIEAPSLLQSRQEIPLIRAQTTFTTLVTARSDAFFLTDGLWAAEVSGSARTVSVCLVAPAGSPTAANAVAWQMAIGANVSDFIVGASGLLIPPGYTLQTNASANDTVNVFGWGWNIVGDAQ